jgi:hypothetical protein
MCTGHVRSLFRACEVGVISTVTGKITLPVPALDSLGNTHWSSTAHYLLVWRIANSAVLYLEKSPPPRWEYSELQERVLYPMFPYLSTISEGYLRASGGLLEGSSDSREHAKRY